MDGYERADITELQAQLGALTARVSALEQQAKPGPVPISSEWVVGISIMHARTRARIRAVLMDGPATRRTLSRRLSTPQQRYVDTALSSLMVEGAVVPEGREYRLA